MREAKKSNHIYKLGAIVVSKNKIVGRGYNFALREYNYKGESTHAEVCAMQNTNAWQVEGADLYVARISGSGELKTSKPCHLCMKRMKKMGIKTVWFIKDNEWKNQKLGGNYGEQ